MDGQGSKKTFLGVIVAMVAAVFICSTIAMAGIISADHLRPGSAVNTNQVYVLEDNLRPSTDGGTAVLSGLYVNGAQQAINSLIQFRDNQYLKAVRSVDTASLVVLPKEGKFAPGHDLYEQLKKNGQSCIAVNIVSYNEIEGHLRAAMANNSAIIFEVARSQIGYAIDEVKVAEYTLAIAKKIGCNIPIVLHGDHIQYGQELFEQATLLKDAYEAVNGKGTFKASMNVNDIDEAILKTVQNKLKENAAKERKDVTAIIERLIKAGFTSVAIDASTLYDEKAGDIVTNYYKTKGTDEEKLVMKLMEAFVLQPEWGIDFLKYDPANEGAQFERIKNEVVGEMQKRNRAQNEIDAIVKDMEVAFGALTAEAKKNGLDPKAVIAAYDKIATDIAGATVGGKISAAILKTVSAKEKMLLLPTSNLAETAFQVKMINELVKKYNPELLGHIGIEIEVGHVDKKVPNPRRGGKLEAQMTHPAAIKVMMDGLAAQGLTFDIVAFNNGSGHGTDYDKDSLTPVSQVGKISPYLTADFARMLGDKAAAAQHGTSGSDMDELNVLSKAGVVKFNIATNNQQTQLNVHFLMHKGLRGVNLIKEIEVNPQKYVEGLSEETRAAMKEMAEGLKNGQIKEAIEEKDSSFVRFIKLTYAWGKKKGKIKDSSSKEDIALVFAKEFKRAFKDMDNFLVTMGKLNLITRIGILTSGGPASGHNNVIYAAFLEAQAQGIELVVIWEGWKGLIKDSLVAKARALTLAEVEAERLNGGTILFTSRENPYSDEDKAKGTPQKVWENIQKLQLDGLITLGGDDTNKVSFYLEQDHPDFPVIGGAKTMDGDIALLIPGAPNYGHSTFVGEATNQIKKALVDYKSTKRIGVVEVFGRSAGFVAARVGAAVNAARSLIPEEKIDLEQFSKDMKAYKEKYGYGVVIVSEGVVIEKPKTDEKGNLKDENGDFYEKDPRILRNYEILQEALAKDDRARAAYEGKNIKEDKFGNPKLEDSAAIISAVLKWGGVSTSLTGKIDYAARSVPIDQLDEKITRLIGQAAVNKIATGEKNQLVYVDSPDIETMQAVSMEFIPKLGGRKMQIEEGSLDRATYLQGNQAMGMAQADGGSAVAAAPQQSFNNVVELYKDMRRADWFEKVQQEEFIMLTPEQMRSVIWKFGTFQVTEDWMWLRRIVRKISPEQVAELKAMAGEVGLGKAMDLALKDINMFVLAGNARIFRAGAFNMYMENKEAGVNVVGVKGLKGNPKKEMNAKDFVNHNSYLNKIWSRYKIDGMKMFQDKMVNVGGLVTPELLIPPDRNRYRPLIKIPFFEGSVTKEAAEAGMQAYDMDTILDAYEKAGIPIDVMHDYGPGGEEGGLLQAKRLLPFAKRNIPMILASPVNKDGVKDMLKQLGKDPAALVEVLYAFNRGMITDKVLAVDTLTCTSNAMLNIIMAFATDEAVHIQNFFGETWHSATDSNSIFTDPSGRSRQLIDWLRGISILDNFIPSGTGAKKNLGVVIKSLLSGGFEEHEAYERVKDLEAKGDIDAVRTGTFAGSSYRIVFSLEKPITLGQIQTIFKKFAREKSDDIVQYYEGVEGQSDTPLDLNKIVGEPYVSIVDGLQLKVIGDGRMVVITGYYDNQMAAPGQMLTRHGARIVDARRAKEAIASRPAAAVADGGSFKTLDRNMFGRMAQGFISFRDSLKNVKSVRAGLIINARAVIKNAGTVETLRYLKQASPDLAIVIWADNQIQVDQVKAMGLEDIATIELKQLAPILSELNDQGISNDRIVLINATDIIHALSVAEFSLLEERGVKIVRLGVARDQDKSVNSMPLVVARAVTSVMPEQETVVKEYNKLTQSYLDNGQISQADMQALNDLTASLTDAPLVKVSEELAKIQTAYEATVGDI